MGKTESFESNLGFTLVELLIVISIIGILTGVLVMILNPKTTQQKARDGIRKSNVAKLAEAVEAYNAGEGSYPGIFSDLMPVYVKSIPDGKPSPTDVYNYDSYTDGACVWIVSELTGDCIKYRTNWGEVQEGRACDCSDG